MSIKITKSNTSTPFEFGRIYDMNESDNIDKEKGTPSIASVEQAVANVSGVSKEYVDQAFAELQTLLDQLNAKIDQNHSGPVIIQFTMVGIECTAEEGMTWEEWVNSSYNTIGAFIYYGGVCYEDTNGYQISFGYTSSGNYNYVAATDKIIANRIYSYEKYPI